MAVPIEHIVVLMLENNSFDRMLGCMNSVYPELEGPRAAPNEFTNPDYPDANRSFPQLPGAENTVAVDPAHDLDDVLRQINGGACDGFVADFAQHKPQAPETERYQIMDYFEPDSLPVLHTLARNYLICDHWFSSFPGPTWPNRFFVHSGTSLGHIDMPSGIFHPALHIYDQPTVYQRLEEKNISWRIYYGDVPQSLLMTKQLEFPTHYRRMADFSADTQGDANAFPQYVFIEPCYFGAGQNDQHPPSDVMHGEALIANVYNLLRANEDLWRTTLLVLVWDEHGGFFDHVPPPPTVAPDGNTKDFAFDRLGVRVPALLISPWVDPGVYPAVLDHTSLLKYLTDKWELGPLGNRVPQANSFASAIARTSARPDCIRSVAAAAAQPNNTELPFNAQQVALASFTHHLEVNYTKPDDKTVADHSRAMTSDFGTQSRAVSQRVEEFLRPVKAPAQAAAS